MSRETAVTEEISYATHYCDVCGDEVIVDEAPDSVIEPQGYAILLGEGEVTHESEEAGNWDKEIHFELEKEASHLPTVSAYIVCENCAEAVHGISPETMPYTGTVPSELSTQQDVIGAENLDGKKGLLYLAGAIVLIFFLLFVFL